MENLGFFIVLTIILVILFVFQKKVFRFLRYLLVCQRTKIEGEYVSDWETPFFVSINTIEDLNRRSDTSIGLINRYFVLIKKQDNNEIVLETSLYLLHKMKGQHDKGKKISLVCEKHEWEKIATVDYVLD